MTTTASAAQQALILQLLQQQQLQLTADTRAATNAQAVKASSPTTNPAMASSASINTAPQQQVTGPLSAVLSQLGSREGATSTHDDRHQQDRKVDQIVRSYGEQGPSDEMNMNGTTTPAA